MTDTDRHDDQSAAATRDVGPGWPPAGMEGGPKVERPSREGKASDDHPGYQTGGLRLGLMVVALAALGLFAGVSVLVMVLGVVVMIFLHELGHFITAKWSGMKVTEFFIGFGPKIWSFSRGETEYGVKVIPAGAYVRIIGMNNLDEVDAGDEPRTYRQQSFPRRLLVVCAGSLMHFAQAFVLLVVLLGVVGAPGGTLVPDRLRPESWQVMTVTPDSAAERAGLRDGDQILSVDGVPASAHNDFREFIDGKQPGDSLTMTVASDGATREISIELGERPAEAPGGPTGGPFLGVGTTPEVDDRPIGVGSAIVRAPGELTAFMGYTVSSLAGFFSPEGLGDFAQNVSSANDPEPKVAEPGSGSGSGSGSSVESNDSDGNRMISILGVVRLGTQAGWVWMLFLFFQINVFIGVFNLVPLPPLDGGHAVVAIYERLRSRSGRRYHADIAKLLPLTYAVVMGLVVLGVSALYLDIVNPIKL